MAPSLAGGAGRAWAVTIASEDCTQERAQEYWEASGKAEKREASERVRNNEAERKKKQEMISISQAIQKGQTKAKKQTRTSKTSTSASIVLQTRTK